MPLGVVSQEDFLKELTDTGRTTLPVANKVVVNDVARVDDIARGRGAGNTNKPDDLRRIISDDAINGIPVADIEAAFGVSSQSIAAYKHGATSLATYNKPSDKVAPHVNAVKERISRRASKRLDLALNEVTKEKLADAKLRDVVAVAQAMSSIVKNMEPPTEVQHGNNVQFVFMAPHLRHESDFKVITVNE